MLLLRSNTSMHRPIECRVRVSAVRARAWSGFEKEERSSSAHQACAAPCCGSRTGAAVLLRLLDIDLRGILIKKSANMKKLMYGAKTNYSPAAAFVAGGSTAADRHKPSAAAAAGSLFRLKPMISPPERKISQGCKAEE